MNNTENNFHTLIMRHHENEEQIRESRKALEALEEERRRIERKIREEIMLASKCYSPIVIINKKDLLTKEVKDAVYDAIKDLNKGGEKLKKSYFGVKSYEGWQSQRSDHEYGYGPKHGAVWFRIEILPEYRKRDLSPGEIGAGIKRLGDYLENITKTTETA